MGLATNIQTARRASAPAAIRFHDHHPSVDDFRDAFIKGLSRPQKSLSCRFLYDQAGSALFEQICDQPEYYPTRTEAAILANYAPEMAELIGAGAQLIELGSGAGWKVRTLLDALDRPAGYVPIDISGEQLLAAAAAIQADYPDLEVDAICADYGTEFPLPAAPARRVGFYPGSTMET